MCDKIIIKVKGIPFCNAKYLRNIARHESFKSYPDSFKAYIDGHGLIYNKDYVYAANKEGEWVLTSGSSRKYDVLFINTKWIKKYVSLVNSNDKNTNNIDKTKENNNVNIDNDEYNNIPMEPPDIDIPAEMFFEDGDNCIYLTFKGKLTYLDCFTEAKKFGEEFNIERLDNLINKNETLFENIDYKYFLTPSENTLDKRLKYKKTMFLTFTGMIKVLMASNNPLCRKYHDWVCQVLFTVHIGNDEQKYKLAGNLIGASHEAVKSVFKTFGDHQYGNYLFKIGDTNSEKLCKQLGIEMSDGSKIICKLGRSREIMKTSDRHHRSYTKETDNAIELLFCRPVDPKYQVEAENAIIKYFKKHKYKLHNKKFKEIAVFPKKKLKKIIRDLDEICKKYLGCYTDIVNKMEDQEKEHKHEIRHLKKDYEHKLKIENKNKDLLKKEINLLEKDNEILQIKLDNAMKEINALNDKLNSPLAIFESIETKMQEFKRNRDVEYSEFIKYDKKRR